MVLMSKLILLRLSMLCFVVVVVVVGGGGGHYVVVVVVVVDIVLGVAYTRVFVVGVVVGCVCCVVVVVVVVVVGDAGIVDSVGVGVVGSGDVTCVVAVAEL